jgi:hypothetical protein
LQKPPQRSYAPVTLTDCEIVEIAEKLESARHAEPIRYHLMVQRHLCVSTLDNSVVARRTCSPRRITFMTQALTKPPGPSRSGPPCRSRLRAGAYSNAKLHPWREKGKAPDISVDWGESWCPRQGESIFRVCGYGEEGWLIGSSLNSSIQAVPLTLLSNFIDGCRITWTRRSLVCGGTTRSCSTGDQGVVPVNCPKITSKRAGNSASQIRNRIPWSVVKPSVRIDV